MASRAGQPCGDDACECPLLGPLSLQGFKENPGVGGHLARANRNSTTRLGPAAPVLGPTGIGPLLFLLLPCCSLGLAFQEPS